MNQAYAYARRPGHAGFAPAGMVPRRSYAIGAAGDETMTDKITNFLNEKTGPLENKWWLGGAAVVGIAIYGKSKRWF